MLLEIHLDLVGGLAGDMFIAAVLDAYPQLESCVGSAIAALGDLCPVSIALHPHRDDVLCGKRFSVTRNPQRSQVSAVAGVPFASQHLLHSHTTWKSIRTALSSSTLTVPVKRHALAIFTLLAEAEAAVHGNPMDEVSFHEVGAWDSIADIVAAAALIVAVDASRWTFSPIPLGSGRVHTDHGLLPVPAPATARLLLGLPTLDDGIAGERVTPTGVAICRYLHALCPEPPGSERGTRKLAAIGMGFGSRKLCGISNHVRILCFEPVSPAPDVGRRGWNERAMHVIEFEVDDQSGEELAMGLEHLRAGEGILDVIQYPVFGKKGRIMFHVRLLVRLDYLDDAIAACFRQTTTIGLRHREIAGVGLTRQIRNVDLEGRVVRVKVVERPGARTAKTESDDVRALGDHSSRASARGRAEDEAIERTGVNCDA